MNRITFIVSAAVIETQFGVYKNKTLEILQKVKCWFCMAGFAGSQSAATFLISTAIKNIIDLSLHHYYWCHHWPKAGKFQGAITNDGHYLPLHILQSPPQYGRSQKAWTLCSWGSHKDMCNSDVILKCIYSALIETRYCALRGKQNKKNIQIWIGSHKI